MTERTTPDLPANDGPGLEPAAAPSSDDGPLQGIREFAAAEAAELADLGALLSQLRAALPEPPDPDRVIDADAVWQRVLDRLDGRG